MYADENSLLKKKKLLIWEKGGKITEMMPLSRETG